VLKSPQQLHIGITLRLGLRLDLHVFACIVDRTGHSAYRYGIYQTRSSGMISRSMKKCRSGIKRVRFSELNFNVTTANRSYS